MTTITIPGNTMSLKNSKRIIMAGGRPRLLSSQPYEAWANHAGWELKASGLIDHKWRYPVTIHFHFVRATKQKFDYINLAQGPLDLLVQAGILKDDDMTHVIPGRFTWAVDKENPRCELTIEEMQP